MEQAKECCGAATCEGGCESPKCAPPTLGEAAMNALRGFGSEGATAAEVAACVRRGGSGPAASTPAVEKRLIKYAQRGAIRIAYVTVREGDTERPAETVARFYVAGAGGAA